MISVKNVTMRFGDRTVLDDVSLEVAAGQIMAIMGSSGGGKTTLLRCIAGLLNPISGNIFVAGIDVQREPEAARHRLGMVFQGAALFDSLSVRDNILFGVKRHLRLSESEQNELAECLMEMVGLGGAGELLPGQLSGGMKKRVGIARALALKPGVVLYDEPVTGLDPITAYTIDELIVGVRNQHRVTSLVVSHDVTSVYRVADQVAFLENGKLSFVGTTDEFKRDTSAPIHELLKKSSATEISL